MKLEGKVALVTGASGDIGGAIARRLGAAGAHVIVTYVGQAEFAATTAADIEASGGTAVTMQLDQRDPAAIEACMAAVTADPGRLDILVNNAGTSAAGKFEDVSNEVWVVDLQLKLYGAIYCSRAALPHLKRAEDGGRIINITTHGGKAPAGGSLPTSAARAAGLALTKAMSRDYARDGVLVNTVCIGLIKSGQIHARFERMREDDPSLTAEGYYERLGSAIPIGRVGEAREAGDVICFLASARASYLTGTSVNIDGGASPVV